MNLNQQVYADSNRELAKLLKEQKRRRGLYDLWFFNKYILGYSDLTDEKGFHGKYCRHLTDDKYKFKLNLTPRGTLKSSVDTIGESLQEITRNPNVRILIGSKKFSVSVAFLAELKGHIEKNEVYRDLYGDLVGTDTWNKTEIIVRTRTHWKKEPTVMCCGIDVTTTGLHYDVIKVDDPHDDLNTMNQDQIDKVIRWYKLLLSLLDPGGRLHVTGTIWHYNDLYNHIITLERERIEKGQKKRFKIFKRDSFIGTNQDLMNGNVTHDQLLWPERLSADFLKDQYIEQGPYIFSCQYRLNPIDDDTATFKRSWLKACDIKEVPDKLHTYSLIDPMRDEEGKDFLAIDTVGIDKDWQLYVLDVLRVKADEHDTVDAMTKVYKEFKPIRMGMETVAWQKSFYRYTKMLAIMKGIKLPVTELKTDTKVTKRMRIKSMVPYFKAGLITLVVPDGNLLKAKGGMATLIDELTRYPKTATDDCVDALAYADQLTKRPGVLQILKQIPANSFIARRLKVIGSKKKRLGIYNVRSGASVA